MKKRNIFAGLLLAVLMAAFTYGETAQYQVDKVHTNIGFSVSHMVINKVKGNFTDYNIDFNFDQKNIANSALTVHIKIASINTENQKRDNHLRSSDFFDAANHPDMVFKSTKIEKKDRHYVAHGTLTIRGVTKELALPFIVKGPITDPWGNIRVGIEAELTINRQDYGVSWSKMLDGGGLVVGNEVEININAEFLAG